MSLMTIETCFYLDNKFEKEVLKKFKVKIIDVGELDFVTFEGEKENLIKMLDFYWEIDDEEDIELLIKD